jgi:hypothetical protein
MNQTCVLCQGDLKASWRICITSCECLDARIGLLSRVAIGPCPRFAGSGDHTNRPGQLGAVGPGGLSSSGQPGAYSLRHRVTASTNSSSHGRKAAATRSGMPGPNELHQGPTEPPPGRAAHPGDGAVIDPGSTGTQAGLSPEGGRSRLLALHSAAKGKDQAQGDRGRVTVGRH